MHHAERFEHHRTAIETAKNIRLNQVMALAERYETNHPGWSGAFLVQALEIVIQCRELLANTYIASYSLPDDYPDRPLYEFLQGNLEAQTDALNSLLSDFNDTSSNEAIFKASATATQQYFQRMIEALEHGLSKGYEVIHHPPTVQPQLANSSQSSKWDWFGFLKK